MYATIAPTRKERQVGIAVYFSQTLCLPTRATVHRCVTSSSNLNLNPKPKPQYKTTTLMKFHPSQPPPTSTGGVDVSTFNRMTTIIRRAYATELGANVLQNGQAESKQNEQEVG